MLILVNIYWIQSFSNKLYYMYIYIYIYIYIYRNMGKYLYINYKHYYVIAKKNYQNY